jgi:hypothetical protein
MAGFVYIMSNPAFPSLIKIGCSDRDPGEFRKKELESTGVPEPFTVEYWAFIENHQKVERLVHLRFATQRPNKNREFFDCTVGEAVSAIRELGEVIFEHEHERVSPSSKICGELPDSEDLKAPWVVNADNENVCSECNGSGQVKVKQGFFSLQQTCPICRGTG